MTCVNRCLSSRMKIKEGKDSWKNLEFTVSLFSYRLSFREMCLKKFLSSPETCKNCIQRQNRKMTRRNRSLPNTRAEIESWVMTVWHHPNTTARIIWTSYLLAWKRRRLKPYSRKKCWRVWHQKENKTRLLKLLQKKEIRQRVCRTACMAANSALKTPFNH